MECVKEKCKGTELSLKKVIFRNGKMHLKSYCPNCYHSRYYKQTPENLEIFKNVKTKKSSALEKVESLQFLNSPEKFIGRFGSDHEQLFAISLKQKYTATVLKRGCPDFLIECKGKIFFVEIKHGNDRLSRYQHKYIELLEKLGIKVFISDGDPSKEILKYLED